MYILGINSVFHDSSASLLKDGNLIAAAEEERFTEIKHGKRPIPFSTYEMPFHAVHYCLKEAKIALKDVDHIAYSFDPSALPYGKVRSNLVQIPLTHRGTQEEIGMHFTSPWDGLFLSAIKNAPYHLKDGYPHHLEDLFVGAGDVESKWHFVNHHLAHAASAFLPSPYERAAILTLDGRGEVASTSYYNGSGNSLNLVGEVLLPHSLGLLYEKMTSWLGFLHSSDEYKVMALASYGKPAYISTFKDMISVEGGNYTIDQKPFEELFGPARVRSSEVTQRHYDIAHSVQYVLEETVLELCRWLRKETGQENLCMAGGVALNCVLNARIRDRGPFRSVWVQPAAGDAGTSLGAALHVDLRERKPQSRAGKMNHVFYGPGFSDDEIEEFLTWAKVSFRKMSNPAKETAALLANDRIIGWFQGRMEFGPRALGGRSILASPLHADMQARLNEVKDREDFRPVAPAVLQEKAGEWFQGCDVAPYMLFVYDVVKGKEDQIPAVRHVDGTARVQTVSREQNPPYYDLLQEFESITCVPVLINTSFNTRGKPVVCSPRDAVACFYTSPFDALVMGSYLIEK